MKTTGPRGKARFSKLLGISPSTYEYYEGGRVPPAHILIKISAVANIDLEWLLTGQDGQESTTGSGADLAAAKPILQRISTLLDTKPQAIEALTAFLDILTQSLELPAKQQASGDLADGQAETPEKIASLESGAVIAGVSDGDTTTPGEGDIAINDDGTAVDSGVAGNRISGTGNELHPDPSSQHAGWLPILGRSAAGVPRFWSEKDINQTLTTLDELIVRHANISPEQTSPAIALTDQGDPFGPINVQVVTLADPAPGQPGQFLVADEIKKRYRDAFAVQIDGNSMSPEIEHGDFVILSPSVSAEDGRPAVIQLVGQIGVTCKILRQADDQIHLIPINEQFAPQPFPASSVVWALRVLARVRA